MPKRSSIKNDDIHFVINFQEDMKYPGKRDPEMSSTRKNGQWYFGMKAHIGTDAKSGMVHSVEVTPAKTADVDMTMDLLHGQEKAVFGDKGYMKKEDKRWGKT